MRKIYTFRSVDIVSVCNSFVIVATVGRCYCCEESDGRVWMYGIHPGAVAACADEFDETVLLGGFFARYTHILRDAAAEAASAEEFESEIKQFVLHGSGCEDHHSCSCSRVNCMTKKVSIHRDSADEILGSGVVVVHRAVEESPDVKDLFLGNIASIANDFLQYPEGSQERIAAETVVTGGHALRIGADLAAFDQANRVARSWLESVFSAEDREEDDATN